MEVLKGSEDTPEQSVLKLRVRGNYERYLGKRNHMFDMALELVAWLFQDFSRTKAAGHSISQRKISYLLDELPMAIFASVR